MPEFVLDRGSPEASKQFAALDSFTQGYIEAMFFTDNAPNAPDVETFNAQCESGENEGSFHGDATFDDMAPEALAKVIADCTAFQASNAELLARAYVLGEAQVCYNEARAGHDLWLTRNGHGAGFWDRSLGEVGDMLSKACGWRTSFGEVDMYRGDDGKVYLS